VAAKLADIVVSAVAAKSGVAGGGDVGDGGMNDIACTTRTHHTGARATAPRTTLPPRMTAASMLPAKMSRLHHPFNSWAVALCGGTPRAGVPGLSHTSCPFHACFDTIRSIAMCGSFELSHLLHGICHLSTSSLLPATLAWLLAHAFTSTIWQTLM